MKKVTSPKIGFDTSQIIVRESFFEQFWDALKLFFLDSKKDSLPQIRTGPGGVRGYSWEEITGYLGRGGEEREGDEGFKQFISQANKNSLPEASRALAEWRPGLEAGGYMKKSLSWLYARPPGDLIRVAGGAGIVVSGAVVGNLLPDWDISLLGIGMHRNPVFHSGLPLWAAYKLHKWAVNRIQAPFDSPLDLAGKAVGLFIAGGALGASTHLFIDSTIQGSKAVIWPLLGSLVSGTLLDDQVWLAAGALVSLYVAFREFEYVLGEDHPAIVTAREVVNRALEIKERAAYWVRLLIRVLIQAIKAVGSTLQVMFGEPLIVR